MGVVVSILEKKLQSVSRRFEDVNVVLDGQLVAEREALAEAAVKAPSRLAAKSNAEAALAEWDAAHRDAVLTVRVQGCIGSEWTALQLKNPAAKDQANRSPEESRYGFDLAGAVVDALMQFGQIVDGDTVEEPSEELWGDLWESLANADRGRITKAVIDLNGTPSEKAFGDLLKA